MVVGIEKQISPRFHSSIHREGGLVVGIEKQILPSFHSCIHVFTGKMVGKPFPMRGPLYNHQHLF